VFSDALLLQPGLSHLDSRVRCTGPAQGAEIDVGLPNTGAYIVDNDSAGASGLWGRRLSIASALGRPSQDGCPARKVPSRTPAETGQSACDGNAVTSRSGVGTSARGCKSAAGSIGKCDIGRISGCCRRDVRCQRGCCYHG
jgi:hypothetical protein